MWNSRSTITCASEEAIRDCNAFQSNETSSTVRLIVRWYRLINSKLFSVHANMHDRMHTLRVRGELISSLVIFEHEQWQSFQFFERIHTPRVVGQGNLTGTSCCWIQQARTFSENYFSVGHCERKNFNDRNKTFSQLSRMNYCGNILRGSFGCHHWRVWMFLIAWNREFTKVCTREGDYFSWGWFGL
jgi:hypothetical protein